MNSDALRRSCPWMLQAMALVGTREISGPSHNSVILRMWESIKAPFRDDEAPWCAAFVGHCLETSGVPSTRSASARSYLSWGHGAEGAWDRSYGGVAILSRPGKAWSGHVGFLTGVDRDTHVVQLLSGNSDNRVRFAEYPLDRLLDVRLPLAHANTPTYGGMPCPPFKAAGNRARSDA